MSQVNQFEVLKKYINLYDINTTFSILEKLEQNELEICFHALKRNQVFNIKTPMQFKDKLKFIQNFNEKIKNKNFPYYFKLYFEFIEKIYITMESFYSNFMSFYMILEEKKQTDIFITYLFAYYDLLHRELEQYNKEVIEEALKKGILDSTTCIGIPNMGSHVNDIDGQIQFIAKFIKININFYKFMSNNKNIQLMPVTVKSDKVNDLLAELFERENSSILKSFNSWENGINQITLVNLFDWQLIKNNEKKTIFTIKPKRNKMTEYINQEYGAFIYQHFKHVRNYNNTIKQIIPELEYKNIKKIILLEYTHIKDVFESEYYICSSVFSKIYLKYPIELYVKFFLIYRIYYSYFDKNKLATIHILSWEMLLQLFLPNIDLFKNDRYIKNEAELYYFIKSCLDFYTNNGDDIFNYPFFKYNSESFAITSSIISTNLPRMFLEKFKDIKLDNDMSSKGKILEQNLLNDSCYMVFSGIKVLKNIELFESNEKITDIDFLIYDGKDLLIAELKNQYIYNGYEELYKRKKELSKKAVQQINIAKSYLLKNEKRMSRVLGIDLTKIRNIVPIVITTLDELNNTIINNTLVVSAYLFKTYFNYDYFVIKDHNLKEEKIIKKMPFRGREIKIENFIEFIRHNQSIKLLRFFSDKKINTQTIFEYNNLVFKRTILSLKSKFK